MIWAELRSHFYFIIVPYTSKIGLVSTVSAIIKTNDIYNVLDTVSRLCI